MKPMKVPTDNLQSSATPAVCEAQRQLALDALTAALTAVNGTARSHTYTAGQDLRDLALDAEARLVALGIPASSRAGAELHAKSGVALPNAYAKTGRTVIRTGVVLRRLKTAWVCTEIRRVEDRPTTRPSARLHLTMWQDDRAVAALRAAYSIPGICARHAAMFSVVTGRIPRIARVNCFNCALSKLRATYSLPAIVTR